MYKNANIKTLQELYIEYWERIYNMCKDADINPWRCVRTRKQQYHCGKVISYFEYFDSHPKFDEIDGYIEFAVAILDDKPVFIGDTLYSKVDDTRKYIVISSLGCNGFLCNRLPDGPHHYQLDWDSASWQPPKPKRTFKLNGVELPCPIDSLDYPKDRTIKIAIENGKRASRFLFADDIECDEVFSQLREIFIEARHKQ